MARAPKKVATEQMRAELWLPHAEAVQKLWKAVLRGGIHELLLLQRRVSDRNIRGRADDKHPWRLARLHAPPKVHEPVRKKHHIARV